MFYLTYAPGPPISEFVDHFWLFDGGETPRKERIVPSGTIELVINLRDDEIRIHDRERSEQLTRFFRRGSVRNLFEHICRRRNAARVHAGCALQAGWGVSISRHPCKRT